MGFELCPRAAGLEAGDGEALFGVKMIRGSSTETGPPIPNETVANVKPHRNGSSGSCTIRASD